MFGCYETQDEMITRMVDERYPCKMGFSSFNEEERDVYRRGLEEGMRLIKLDND